MNIDILLALGKLTLEFGRTYRATFHEDGQTPESDTDHTVMLQVIACTVARDFGFDVGLTCEYATVHDIVEARTPGGDTNTFGITPERAQEKAQREAIGLKSIVDEFGESSWLVQRILEYEAQEIPEAQLVRYLDKATPKITHALNGGAAIKHMGKTRLDLIDEHRKQLSALNEKYPELAETIGPIMENIMIRSVEAWTEK